jgi:hypothetical protein
MVGSGGTASCSEAEPAAELLQAQAGPDNDMQLQIRCLTVA